MVASPKKEVASIPHQLLAMRNIAAFDSEHSGRSTVPTLEYLSSRKDTQHSQLDNKNYSSRSKRRCSSDQKRVSFRVDKNDNILANVVVFESPPEEASADIYWGETKLVDIYNQAKEMANDFRICRLDLLDSIKVLYGSPDTAKPKTTNDFSTNQAMEILALSPARGLEHQITSVIHKHRVNAIESVLTTQDKLKFKDPEQTATILRLRSLQVSRRDREFALKLAQGDALVAQSASELI